MNLLLQRLDKIEHNCAWVWKIKISIVFFNLAYTINTSIHQTLQVFFQNVFNSLELIIYNADSIINPWYSLETLTVDTHAKFNTSTANESFPLIIYLVNMNKSAGNPRICSHLLKITLTENFISCTEQFTRTSSSGSHISVESINRYVSH